MNDRNERIAAAFERLFRTYDRPGQGDAEVVARDRIERARVYFEAVEAYEARDVEDAISNFLRGVAPGFNPAFVPPAPQVGAEVRRVMNLRLDSEARSRAVRPSLPPPDVKRSPESRERVAALMAEQIEKLAAGKRTEDAAAEKRRAELLARTNAHFDAELDEDGARPWLAKRPWYGIGDPDGAMD